MPSFVVRGKRFLLIAHDHGTALRAHHDLVLGLLEMLHVDRAPVFTSSEQRRFVDQVGQIRTRESGVTASDDARLDVRIERDLPHMYLQNLLPAADVGQRHNHLPVESARAQ